MSQGCYNKLFGNMNSIDLSNKNILYYNDKYKHCINNYNNINNTIMYYEFE